MPLYRFAVQGNDPPLDEPPEWFPDDVEALKGLGTTAAELARNKPDSEPIDFIGIVRSAKRPES
jgi:hypothetical protein